MITFVCVDVTDCCFLLFEVLHLFSVYFDLNIGCLIIGILKYEEQQGPTNQNKKFGTHISDPDNWDPFEKKEKTGNNPKIKRPNYSWASPCR